MFNSGVKEMIIDEIEEKIEEVKEEIEELREEEEIELMDLKEELRKWELRLEEVKGNEGEKEYE